MASPFLGEIRLFGFNFAPRGWAFCQGQLIAIAQNSALFALLGTIYGGDGQTTFALPDLRGRVPVSFGQGPGLPNVTQGQRAGEVNHTLNVNEMPGHNHAATAQLNASGSAGNSTTPSGNFPAVSTARDNVYSNASGATLNAAAAQVTVAAAGGSQPHNNMQPYLGLNFCIAVEGIFPSRN